MEEQKKSKWGTRLIYATVGIAALLLVNKACERNTFEINKEVTELKMQDSIREMAALPVAIDSLMIELDRPQENAKQKYDNFNNRVVFYKKVARICHLSQQAGIDPTYSRKGRRLKKSLSSLQTREFPIFRKSFVKTNEDMLWEEDIDVSTNGTKNDVIVFTGAAFAPNRNKKKFMETIYPTIKKLRFKRVIYKWYKYDDESIYYDIDSLKDQDTI